MGEGVSKMAKKIPTSFMDGPLIDIYGVYFALMNYAEGSVQNVRDSNSYNLHPHTRRKYIRSCFMALHFIFVNELKSESYGYFSCVLAA